MASSLSPSTITNVCTSTGFYVPAVLFFDEAEDFDFASIKAHILRLAEGGVTGILVQGSNGEAQHLSHEERKEAIRFTRETLDDNGFQNVLGGEESGTHNMAIYLIHVGTTNLKVANASPIPTMVYNFPVVTAGQDLDSDIIAALAQHPNIVGTKLSCGNIGKLHRLASTFPASEFTVFAGRSDLFLQGLMSGSAGAIAASVNLFPKVHREIYKLFQEGKMVEAMELQAQLGHADWAVGRIGGIGGIKAIAGKHFGYGGKWVRGPLKHVEYDALTGKHVKKIEEMIKLEKSL
ncbi:aldolase [Salix suchowensis]|nr:aldolase [Salix suchowensis]